MNIKKSNRIIHFVKKKPTLFKVCVNIDICLGLTRDDKGYKVGQNVQYGEQ